MVNLFDDRHLGLLLSSSINLNRSRWPCGVRRSGSICWDCGFESVMGTGMYNSLH